MAGTMPSMSTFTTYSDFLPGAWEAELSRLADELRVSCIDWRADARTVMAAYTQWSDAGTDDEPALFAAYLAALDHEESVANEYELLMHEFDLLLWRDPTRL